MEHLTNIVYNDKNKDVSLAILDKDTDLTEYKTKKHYLKPNPNVNIYMALYTRAHAKLRLYNLLDILQEKVMFVDTDSCIFHDEDTEACKKIKSIIRNGLGELSEVISDKHKANYIKIFVSTGPKDYSCELVIGKIVGTCKGFRMNNEAEEKLQWIKKINLVTNENEKYALVRY